MTTIGQLIEVWNQVHPTHVEEHGGHFMDCQCFMCTPMKPTAPIFGQPIPTKTQMKAQAKGEKQRKKLESNSYAFWDQAAKIWHAAIRLQDARLLYCWKCGRPIGFNHHVFSHECGIACKNHQHLPNAECIWWTDMREKQAREIATCEQPGTLWAEEEV